MSECLQLLKDLVAIPSVNPVYGGPGEAAVQRFVEERLASKGIAYELQEVFPGRNNVVARIGPEDKPAVLFEAHMDTVGVDGWAQGSPYEPFEKDGRLYGRGACDTKASLAVFLLLAERLKEWNGPMEHAFVFAATVDEEARQMGAYRLAESFDALNIAAAVTGEPTRSAIITQHKGACRYQIIATGKAAHGSSPDLGENAIVKMTRIITALEALRERWSGEEGRPSIEINTLNVGKISGGIGFNIVPDRCALDLDCRLGVTGSLDSLQAEIRAVVEGEDGVTISSSLERPALNTGEKNWFPQALRAAAEKAGIDSHFGEAAFMTNGVAYSSAGRPTLVFGPGDIAQAHKIDEYIELGEMERSLAILEAFFGITTD